MSDFFTNYEEISKIPGPSRTGPGGEQADERKSIIKRITDYFGMLNPHHWIFLIILGFLTAMTGCLIDISVEWI